MSTDDRQPLIDRAFAQVRGALWGLVTVMGMAVLGMGTYIWTGHINHEAAENRAQDERLTRFWAEHEKVVEKFKTEQAAYQAYNAQQVTERVKFESRALAIMERLDKEVDELRKRKR